MKLVLQIHNKQTKEISEEVFDRLPVLMGRSKICDLVLSDQLASRQHCIIESTSDGQLRLVDLQSANGTHIDGKKIDKSPIDVGSSFWVGDTEISIDKYSRTREESTVHDLTPIGPQAVNVPEGTKTRLESPVASEPVVVDEASSPSASPSEPSHSPHSTSGSEVTLKTPSVFHRAEAKPRGKIKSWVQVSLFWKGELLDIKCFDRGDLVHVGTGGHNDFVLHSPDLPSTISLLKIQPQGLELNLHPTFTGVVETRQGSQDLNELRKTARQTELGFTAYVPFRDRCLIELGPFTLFIQAVNLRMTESLETPLVKEPLYSGILGSVSVFFVLFLLLVGGLSEAREEVEEEFTAVVQLEPPVDAPKPPVREVPPPPKPKKPAVKQGAKASQKRNIGGTAGQGARAKGAEGTRGREKGKVKTKARPIGFETKKAPPKRTRPKGALGDQADRSKARQGLRKSQGVGTGSKKAATANQQQASPKPKPKVRVEDQGILGVLGGKGGGGSARSGGEMEGSGLGGELEGALAGLGQGSDIDAKGSGGRGNRGRSFGGGGSSLDVGGLGTKGKGGGSSGFGLGSSGTKGEAEVSYVAEEVEVRDGLTREEIERVVRAHQNEIRACYEKSLIRSGNMNLSGRLKVGWFVNRNGRAERVAKESTFGAEAGLFDCVSSRIRAWQFPRPRGGLGAQVSWPFVFTKGG